MEGIQYVQSEIAELRAQLKNHALYKNLRTLSDIKVFMEYHVFAVWDFMSLLKSLQIEFTKVTVPWIPSDSPELARFINEIVYAEESDINEIGEPKSHFEMYLDAMNQIEADTSKIDDFMELISLGDSPDKSMTKLGVDRRVIDFVKFSFSVVDSKKNHLIASAFTFGREDVIPDMFIEILRNADAENERYNKLLYYLNRHVELDGDEHGPLSLQMVSQLCDGDQQKWNEVALTARQSLQKRISLWDAVLEKINNHS